MSLEHRFNGDEPLVRNLPWSPYIGGDFDKKIDRGGPCRLCGVQPSDPDMCKR